MASQRTFLFTPVSRSVLPGLLVPLVLILITSSSPECLAQTFTHLSSDAGDLPVPPGGDEQTACLVLDVDGDGLNDFVMAERTQEPSISWYRRTTSGWVIHLIEDQGLPIEAGGDFADIDGDGDLDISFAGDHSSNEVWWWENPAPSLNPTIPWIRRTIKSSGSNKHHDQIFGDFDSDGSVELAIWNQGAGGKLLLMEIPADPHGAGEWPRTVIFDGPDDAEGMDAADIDLDGVIDIVGAGYWFEHIGGATFTPHVIVAGRSFTRTAAGQLIPGGRPEVVICPGDTSGQLTWYEWNGASWLAHPEISTVIHGHSLRLADLDADGNLDIFVAEMHTPGAGDNAKVRVLWGDGAGHFEVEVIETGIGNHESRVADLDGDGDLDILGKPYTDGTPVLHAWLQDGGAVAAWPFVHLVVDPEPVPLTGAQLHGLQVADIDADGHLDIWAAGGNGAGSGQMNWYRGPSWARTTLASGEYLSGAWGDLDGDGDLDLVAGRGSAPYSLAWFRNSGNPSSASWAVSTMWHSLPAPARDIRLADLNDDGLLDVVAWLGAQDVFAFLAPIDPTRAWPAYPLAHATSPRSGGDLGDVDRDGHLDILWGHGWLENPGDPTAALWTDHTIAATWPAQAEGRLIDLNGDGRLDAVLAASVTGQGIAWYAAPPNPASGTWTQQATAGEGLTGLQSLALADFDTDGDLDILVAEEHTGEDPDQVVILENLDGGGLTWLEHVLDSGGSHRAQVADLDGDGDPDIVGKNWQSDGSVGPVIDLWRNDLNRRLGLDSWQRHVIDADKPWRAVLITTGDLDRDGRLDVITGGWWYRNPGDPGGTWARSNLGLPLRNMAAVCDFDRDGDLDVLGTQGEGSTPNADFLWARNTGAGNFNIRYNITDGSGDFLQGVATARYLIDRSRTFNPREVALSWHNGGGGVQMLTVPEDPGVATAPWPHRILTSSTQDEALSAGDIDRDGDLDLLLGTKWLRNDGESWSTIQLNPSAGLPDRNRLADVNGDGRLDAVVGFEGNPEKLVWYAQPGDPALTWPEHQIAILAGPMSLDVGDLDRDGDLDVVVGEHNLADPGSARLIVYANDDGLGTAWTPHTVHVGDEHHDGAQLTDIDGDGDLDIVSIGWTHGRVLLYENQASIGNTTSPQAAPVVISPSGGGFTCTIAVTLATATPGAIIRYTLDGTSPDEASSIYTGTLVLEQDTSLRARAFAPGHLPSAVAAAEFTHQPDTVAPSVVSIMARDSAQKVRIRFSEPVDRNSARNISHYAIDPGVIVLFAMIRDDQQTVDLITSALRDDTIYTLSIHGVTDQACPPNMLVPGTSLRFRHFPWNRVTAGLLAFYTFEEFSGSLVRDLSGVGDPLDLVISDPGSVSWLEDGALEVQDETIIGSDMPAGKITATCRTANAITVEAWISPASTDQNGPARIVTLSAGPSLSNFTLGQGVAGQASDQYVARLRTTETDESGEPALNSGEGSLKTVLQHVVYTRDAAGTARLYIDGTLQTEERRAGSLSTWDYGYHLMLANEQDQVGNLYWQGSYHLLAFYGRALSPEEVSQNYAATSGAPIFIDVQPAIPERLQLYNNTPNPFNPATVISFDLPRTSPVALTVYDLAGRAVRSLLSEDSLTAGRHDVTWDGCDGDGRLCATGIYIYQLRTEGQRLSGRMLLLK